MWSSWLPLSYVGQWGTSVWSDWPLLSHSVEEVTTSVSFCMEWSDTFVFPWIFVPVVVLRLEWYLSDIRTFISFVLKELQHKSDGKERS